MSIAVDEQLDPQEPTLVPVFGTDAINGAVECAKPSIFNRVSARLDRNQAVGESSFESIPTIFRRDAQEAGFVPLPKIRFGFLMKIESFIGPEKYVQLKILKTERGPRSYLQTYFSDGTAIVTSTDPNPGPRTRHLPLTGSFAESYENHLRACAAKNKVSAAMPFRRTTVEDILALRRLGTLAFVPWWLALSVLASKVAAVGALGYLLYTLFKL